MDAATRSLDAGWIVAAEALGRTGEGLKALSLSEGASPEKVGPFEV